jgi:hypothetical protein
LPRWARAKATARPAALLLAAALLLHRLAHLGRDPRQVGALPVEPPVDLPRLRGELLLQALLRLPLGGGLGRQHVEGMLGLPDPRDGGAVGVDHVLLVLGGDQELVQVVGVDQLRQRADRGAAGVDRPHALVELLPGVAQLDLGALYLALVLAWAARVRASASRLAL